MPEQGFTLIELLTVIAILGVLASLTISSFGIYKSKAAYAVGESLLREARNSLEAGLTDADNPPPAVPYTVADVQGPVSDALAGQLLRELQLPRNTELHVYHDPACVAPGCLAEFLQVYHCQAKEYTNWSRFGDGSEVLLQNLAGGGC